MKIATQAQNKCRAASVVSFLVNFLVVLMVAFQPARSASMIDIMVRRGAISHEPTSTAQAKNSHTLSRDISSAADGRLRF